MVSKKSKRHEPRIPLTAVGGIRSQASRNPSSRPWWGTRWILAFEAMHPGARLGRGRSYAIGGQVTRLAYSAGAIDATVQGGRNKPYEVSLRFAVLPGDAAARLSARLAESPLLLARLLVRDLPHRIVSWFEEEGVPLFPLASGDLQATCDCPDWSKTCKHVAAAYLLFGEAMEQNPALLLRLRGVSLPELEWDPPLKGTDNLTSASAALKGTDNSSGETAPSQLKGTGDSSGADLSGMPALPSVGAAGDAPATGESAPIVHRLGPPPFWRGIEKFEDTVASVCRRALPAGWRAWTGEKEPPPVSATSTPEFRPRKGPLRIERI